MLLERLTLNEYLQKISSPLLNTNSPLMQLVPNFINNNIFQLTLKEVLITQYGDYYLREKFCLEPMRARDEITAWYAANSYKYQGLQKSTELEYNPIENYSMTEKGSDITKGGSTDINAYGKRVINDVEGQREDVNNFGEKVVNVNYAEHTDINTQSVSPYDSNTYTQTNQNNMQYGQHQDSTTENSRVDNYIKGKVESTSTELEREDNFDREHHDTIEHELTRSGNIGVTTSQQMLASEREIVDFSIYLTIAKEIMKILCVRVSLENKYIVIDN